MTDLTFPRCVRRWIDQPEGYACSQQPGHAGFCDGEREALEWCCCHPQALESPDSDCETHGSDAYSDSLWRHEQQREFRARLDGLGAVTVNARARRCSTCKTPLCSYNQSPTCYACSKRAFDARYEAYCARRWPDVDEFDRRLNVQSESHVGVPPGNTNRPRLDFLIGLARTNGGLLRTAEAGEALAAAGYTMGLSSRKQWSSRAFNVLIHAREFRKTGRGLFWLVGEGEL